MLNFIINSIIPIFIVVILLIGIKEKKDIFKLFCDGILDGLKVVYKIFPFILSITIAINLLTDTNALNIIILPFSNLLEKLNIPKEIIPLFILRPLSGGASMSLVLDIFKKFGPDSISGKMVSVIMGATETTLYTITILFGAVKIKKIRGVFIAGIFADIVAIVISIILVNIGMI